MRACLPLNTVCEDLYAWLPDAFGIDIVCNAFQVPRALYYSRGWRLSWWRLLWRCGRLGTLARSTSSSTLYGELCSHGVVMQLSQLL